MILFHGGVPGLRAGDVLLPASQTGVSALAPSLPDRVYGVTDRQVARGYAALRPDGGLYRVELLGEVEPDPDCLVDGASWMAPSARVLSVVDPVVLMRSRPLAAWLRMVNFGRRVDDEFTVKRLPVLEQEKGKAFR